MTGRSPITLKEYLLIGKPFVVPYYQRGYIWGKTKATGDNSVIKIIDNLLSHSVEGKEIFLQGVTVAEPTKGVNNGKIVLIDGQQRTTFFYLLLKYLGYEGVFNIEYPIRTSSETFLRNVGKCHSEKEFLSLVGDDVQDIDFFKKTLQTIAKKLKDTDRKQFLEYLLKNVKFLYIVIPEQQAISIFSMMNANRAVMKDEEIIKAELLRLVSLDKQQADLNSTNGISISWEHNELRSRYAREWDKWLHWWRRTDVSTFYHINEREYPLNVLINTYFRQGSNSSGKYNFENFKNQYLRDKTGRIREEKLAKDTFHELRFLQKRFEDAFNSIDDGICLHNIIGGILYRLSPDNRAAFIQSYFAKNEIKDINIYFKLAYLGLTHAQIMNEIMPNNKNGDSEEPSPVEKRKVELYEALSDNSLYLSNYDEAFWQLLRINLECDTQLKRAFDFTIEKQKSLEHIHPQSKVYFMQDGVCYCSKAQKDGTHQRLPDDTPNNPKFFDQKDLESSDCSQHSIGNLVLLYKNENSEFSDKDFEEKKKRFFNIEKNLKSRHLLHSLSVFANTTWTIENISQNKKQMLSEIKNYYGIE